MCSLLLLLRLLLRLLLLLRGVVVFVVFHRVVRRRSSLALFSTSLFNCSISSSIFFGKLVASAIQFTVSVATLSRTVSVSALPRRNASSGPSVVVSARAFGVVPDDDDDDDNGLDDAFEKTSMFWTKLCRRRRRGRRLGVVETEDETGGTPKETMRRTIILAFAFVLHALLLGLLLLRIGTFGFFFSTKH